MLLRFILLLALLAAGCGEAPETDLKLVMIESPTAVGLSLRELPPSVLKSIGLGYGLAVVRADGVAERAGLRMGDVVHGVNQERLHNIDDFRRLVAQASERAATRLLVRRGRSDFYVAIDFDSAPLPGKPNSKDSLLRT
jgi:S1-C subfamily serine protease